MLGIAFVMLTSSVLQPVSAMFMKNLRLKQEMLMRKKDPFVIQLKSPPLVSTSKKCSHCDRDFSTCCKFVTGRHHCRVCREPICEHSECGKSNVRVRKQEFLHKGVGDELYADFKEACAIAKKQKVDLKKLYTPIAKYACTSCRRKHGPDHLENRQKPTIAAGAS